MAERTDEEQGTEPQTKSDWIRDLEGQSDAPAPSESGEQPDESPSGVPDPGDGPTHDQSA